MLHKFTLKKIKIWYNKRISVYLLILKRLCFYLPSQYSLFIFINIGYKEIPKMTLEDVEKFEAVMQFLNNIFRTIQGE